LTIEQTFTKSLLENFAPICGKYDDPKNVDLTDRDQVLEFMGDLVTKMEDDNKWL
jgi:hypothetical protein